MQSTPISGFRLSSQQRYLWIQKQRGSAFPESSQCLVRILGPVSKGRLAYAIDSAVARHEILRTTYLLDHNVGIPLQSINDPTPGSLEEVTDHRDPVTYAQGTESAPSGLRAFLFSHGPNVHVLQLIAPILSLDVKSYRLLLDEIVRLYTQVDHGSTNLPEPLQYADYAGSEDDLFKTETASIGRAFWRSAIVEDTGQTQGEAEKRCFSGYLAIQTTIPPNIVTKIDNIASSNQIPVYSVFLACWGILHGLTGRAFDLLLTYRHVGRGSPELDTALGLFEKYLPLRLKVQSYRKFDEFLVSLRDTLEEHDKWHLSYQADQETDQMSLAPSFRWDERLWSNDAMDVRFVEERIEMAPRCAPFDLLCRRAGNSVHVVLTFDTVSVPAHEAEKTTKRFECILRQVAESAVILIDNIDVLTGSEQQHVLVEWNQTRRDYGQVSCIHHLFERQAAVAPDALALVSEYEQLSYEGLNEWANRLARRLIRLGVGAEVKVGLCLERGLEMVLGLLAVLKAGGAYVPLEPSYPAGRLGQMLEDAQVAVALTEERLKGRLPAVWAQVVSVDGDRGEWAEESGANPGAEVGGRNLAYVIYTSGSTGRPKGVGIEHAQLVNYVNAIQERLRLGADQRMALVTTIAADLGHTMLYPSLCLGGELHVVSEERGRDGRKWAEYRRERSVECVKLTPSHLEALAEAGEGLPSRLLVLGGEECGREWLKRVKGWRGGLEVVNHYGPTECTVGAVTHEVGDEEEGSAPIGRPLGNVRAYVLEEGMRVVPVSSPGELCLGGAGLARGYLNDAGQTAERFVPDGVSGKEGERLYRTGDLVRWRWDGELEFLGRSDQQVKLRGYRIELGEIEAALLQHGGVKRCAVIVREDEPGDKRLAVYVVATDKETLTTAELREHLRDKLPEYMVPAAYMTLSELPLTPNGKLDRKALPAPGAAEGAEGDEGPRTAIEEIVAGIWSEVLRLERVGVRQNFFELGGHSLLATQVISRVREALGVEVPLRVLFESPTVEGLAEAVERERREGRRVEAPPIAPAPRDEELPLSFAQQRLWFLQQLEPESAAYNIPRAVRLRGELEVNALEQSLGEVARRHEALRTRIVSQAGRPVQVIGGVAEVKLPLWDLSEVEERLREKLAWQIATAEAVRTFDLEREAVWRAALVRMGEEDHVLLLCLHHVASDGWSTDILVREFSALYKAYRESRPSPLPELAIQYADYAVWQRGWLQGEALAEHLQYWKKQLAGKLSNVDLPSDHPRPQVPSYRGVSKSILLPAELCEPLKVLSKREGVTLFMTLLAAFKTLLYKYTAEEYIIVGTAAVNRNHAEIEPLIGFFVNMLPMRTDLSGNPRFSELLKRVREVALGAYAHQEMPFEKLVEEIQPERKLKQMPLFNITFGVQNAPKEKAQLSKLNIRSVGGRHESAKYDLSLWITERAEATWARWAYSADLFEEETIIRMHGHFETLLSSIIAQPDAPLDKIEMISEAERTQQAINRTISKEYNYTKFKSVRPKAIALLED